ncbi:hypothetical protein RHSIM_Rhsim12G0082200 [Rhododendron simsii]|uniref:HAT C-terminal dimerisation domain-containing protein n=1 Tax=Rhododendron simsii TaxID=118357 RepID=A0A834L8I1_RHOSS|nr:hypothetical protein RHSIM_Rhsim12G0082200 [Rhododendron simsii]
MRCCAHILNLVVKDGLDVIKVGIEKIRNNVAYWTASQKREENFEETVRQLNVTSTKKLGLDCATRWNSTFLMLQTALLYKDVFIRLNKQDAQYNSLPSEHEWGFARDVIREMAKRMVENFDKYWLVVHGVVGVFAVLDPRVLVTLLPNQVPLMKESLSKYDVYILRESKRSRTIDTAKLELDHYLSEAVLPKSTGFDILNWWKSHQPMYPILQAMARDLLAISVSTVASESAFSTSCRLVSPNRSRLHPDMMEALMCALSWLWATKMKVVLWTDWQHVVGVLL